VPLLSGDVTKSHSPAMATVTPKYQNGFSAWRSTSAPIPPTIAGSAARISAACAVDVSEMP